MSALPVVLISGANQGLGWHATQQLARSGRYKVLLGCRSVTKGEKAKADMVSADASLAPRLSVVELDIQSDASIEKAATEIQSKHGGLDILIDNAGSASPVSAKATMREYYRDVMDLNVASHAVVTDKFTPLLKASKFPEKRVVFVSSSLGSLAHSSDPNHRYFGTFSLEYRSSKAAMNMTAIYFANLLKSSGIGVTIVCPGWCSTAINSYSGPTKPEDGAAQIVKTATEGKNEDVTGRWFGFDNGGPVPW